MPEKSMLLQIAKDITHRTAQKVDLADAHCHLDLISDTKIIHDAIEAGVSTIITDGINIATNRKALKLADWKHIFPALGMDPETALAIKEHDLEKEISETEELIRANANNIVAIGEIGLDYMKAWEEKKIARQKTVFGRMLDLALELNLPVSVHSRNSMNDVIEILHKKGLKKVQLHYFEGDSDQAKKAVELGYMISIPPALTTKRKVVIKYTDISNLMAESDSPVVGKSPKEVDISVQMVANIKEIPFDRAAEALTLNTKRFFNIHPKPQGPGSIRS